MITALDTTSWAQADLDGNGEFLEIITPGSPPLESLYVVSNVRADNSFIILKSLTAPAGSPPEPALLGESFTTVAQYTFPYGSGSPPYSNVEFAPCVAYDPSAGSIHIIGLRNNLSNPRWFDFIKFTFDTGTNTLTGPTILATAESIRSGFDIIVLGNGHTVIGVVLTNATVSSLSPPSLSGQSLVIFELAANDSFISTTQLFNSPNRAPNPTTLITYNSLSLVTPDGVNVELYWEQHPRYITFQDQLFQVFFALRDSSSNWGPLVGPVFTPFSLTAFTGRYSDDRLTVISDGQGGRYFNQTFYTQTNIPEGIVGNLMLGYLQGGPSWSSLVTYSIGQTVNVNGVSYAALASNLNMNPTTHPATWSLTPWFFHGTPGSIVGGSIVESTLSLDQAGSLYVTYLLEDLLTGQVGGPAYALNLASVNLGDLSLTNIPGWYNSREFTWLRGTKSIIDNASTWAVVAEEQTGGDPTVDNPSYLSGLHTPPVAALSPASAIVRRGTPLTLDASASYDTTGDLITYSWSETSPDLTNVTLTPDVSGVTAVLNVARAIGGGQHIFDVLVEESTSHFPVPEGEAIASTIVTVPFNAPPAIEFLSSPPYPVAGSPPLPTIYAGRNSLVTISPTYFGMSDADDLPTYQWVQLAGDAVIPLSFTAPTFTFQTNGLSVDGESLTFEITANDGVTTEWNSSTNYSVGDSAFYGGLVYTALVANVNQMPPNASWTLVGENPACINVIVAPYVNSNVDTLRLSRAIWQTSTGGSPPVYENATISQRNTQQTWSFPDVSGIWSDLQNIKRISVIGGQDRYVVISPASVLVYGGIAPMVVLLRRCLTPNGTIILDAFHTEQDYTLVLDDNNTIYRYTTSYFIDTDNPDTVVDLSSVAPEMTFDQITCTTVHNNIRVIALSGPNGCLLLQVNSQTLAVEAFITISVESHLLYGADNVQWIRMANVESVHSGLILLGSTATAGSPPVTNTYETLFDLTYGVILGVWDKTKLINQIVNTGEILFETISTYNGFPAAPVMNIPTSVKGNVNLTWAEESSNLINSYVVYYSSDGGATFNTVPVGSGSILSIQIQLISGVQYEFYMIAVNNDGTSVPSNTVSVTA